MMSLLYSIREICGFPMLSVGHLLCKNRKIKDFKEEQIQRGYNRQTGEYVILGGSFEQGY